MRTTIEESNTASIARLARQLNKDPETFAAAILRSGIQAIDDAIGNGCRLDLDMMYFGACSARYKIHHECTITGIIEGMTPDELAAAMEDASEGDESVQELLHDRYLQNVNMENLQ